jgi:c-di-GMP-binding flagellar brake protein YcgR
MSQGTVLSANPGVAEVEPDRADVRYTIWAAAEIAYVLKQTLQTRQLVTAYLDGTQNFALTSVLAVNPDANEVILDRGPDQEANRHLMSAKKIILVTSHEQVKVKFAATSIKEVKFEGGPAFRIPMPRWLVRVQRREHYRIATPITKPLICTIPLPQRGPGVQAETIVLDISGGGVALMDNHGALGFQVGERYDDCRIGLPEAGTLSVSLEVRNSFNTELKNGLSFRRFGLKFVDLKPSAENMVQRYIMHLERQRNSRTMK